MTEITWVHRTLIVPAAIVEQCRSLCAASTPAGAGMFVTPLSSDGTEPATHYISAGMLDKDFADLLDSPQAMHDGLAQLGIDVPLPTCTAILGAADVSEEDGFTAMERVGLKMVQPEEVV